MRQKRLHADQASPMVEMTIPNEFDAARAAEEQILRDVEKHGYEPEACFAIRLSVEEALTNAVKHGNKNDRSKRVHVNYRVDPKQVVILIRDEGPGFNPGTVPDPTSATRLSLPNGRGIMLMHAYMDEVQYNQTGNEVRLVKRKQ